jgi:hypothetical protein
MVRTRWARKRDLPLLSASPRGTLNHFVWGRLTFKLNLCRVLAYVRDYLGHRLKCLVSSPRHLTALSPGMCCVQTTTGIALEKYKDCTVCLQVIFHQNWETKTIGECSGCACNSRSKGWGRRIRNSSLVWATERPHFIKKEKANWEKGNSIWERERKRCVCVGLHLTKI